MRTIKRRKEEHKTDYGKRLKLLKSGKPRIVFRRTNKYIIAQYITSEEAQDKIELGITSKILMNYGWPEESKNSLKSIPASYFTGLLFGKEILNKKLKEPIVDFGMLRALHKTKVFAFLKGLVDSGLKIECKKDTFPPKERLEGKHMKIQIPFSKIKSEIEKLKWNQEKKKNLVMKKENSLH